MVGDQWPVCRRHRPITIVIPSRPEAKPRTSEGSAVGRRRHNPGVRKNCVYQGVEGMREEKRYYVYIMTSRSRNLYTGVTGDLYRRVLQHKRGEIEGFTKRYHINRLVYYEEFKYIG